MHSQNRIQIRKALRVPNSRVLASSFDSTNAVEAEYIIEEKARGETLGSLWNQWSMDSKLDVVSQIVDYQRIVASVSFSKHGCIYYKTDLDRRGIVTDSLTNSIDDSLLACD